MLIEIKKTPENEMISGTSFTHAEEEAFKRALRTLKKDNGWTPTAESLVTLEQAVCRPANELVIFRSLAPSPCGIPETTATTPEVLLYAYGTKEPRGKFGPHWTLPGGRELLSDLTTADTVTRVGRKELDTDVKYTGIILFEHKWQPGEHPDGARIHSLYLWCSA